ncbi:MAG TPA: methyltransferase domain-containing protein [Gaiellales bacterium]|nr:methyltransferase domain-containing protein [Gaiellales bacterium]
MIDFGPMAGSYDRLRPAGRAWDEVAELTLARLGAPTRLLDIGCGTGRFTRMAAQRLGARAWGVDPSAEMLAQARSIPGGERIGWKCAAAERLPFRDGWFDAAHMHLVLHLVDDRPAALREMARVLGPGGRAAVVTFSPTHFDRFHLNPWFPSIAAIDRARFPEPAEVARGLRAAGLVGERIDDVRQTVQLEPADVLERVRGRYISTLHLLNDAEYREGLARLEHDLSGRAAPIRTDLHWSLVSAGAAEA